MRIDPSRWFGLALLAALFFLWCLVSLIEAEAVTGGWLWGIVVFGVITIVSAVMALVTFAAKGGRFGRADALSRVEPSAPPRFDGGKLRESNNQRLAGRAEVPRSSAGRALR